MNDRRFSDLTRAEVDLCHWQFDSGGSFVHHLFETISRADGHNRAKLALGFPDHVEAYTRFGSESGYWEALEAVWKNERVKALATSRLTFL
jgi:hypothetical protein